MDELARLLAIDELETGQGANQIHSLKRPGEVNAQPVRLAGG
jgi:hypothetical protein